MLDTSPDSPESFGALLRILRQRAGFTLRELGAQVGYTDSQISRLERDDRLPNLKWVKDRLIPALAIQHPDEAQTLLDLAVQAHRAMNPRPAAAPAGIRESTLRHAVPLTRFIGRVKELDDLVAMLSQRRLVTLCGPGGCGKTRLAIEMAQLLMSKQAQEVWFMDFSTFREPVDLMYEIAASLRIQVSAKDPIGSIARFFNDRPVLMVVDNAEHIIGIVAKVSDQLLHACPNLRMLVTSREPLRLNGETVWRLPPLGLPELADIDLLAGDALRQFEAIELFVECAGLTSGRPDATFDDEAMRTIARICRRLDGLPLAIELAAACTATLSVRDVLTHMDNRFDLLTAGSRIAPDRQVSLEQAIDWSHAMLTQNEQRAFRRLAVFAGGWTLPQAQRVCSDASCSAMNVLNAISGLVHKSMVVFGNDAWERERYSMLESIRAYAMKKLDEADERDAISDRHAECMLDDVEQAEMKLFGDEQASVLKSHETNLDNIRAAFSWLMSKGDYNSALQMAGALRRFWQTRGHVGEGRMWLSRALAFKESAPINIRARAVFTAAVLADYQNDAQASLLLMEEAAQLAQHCDDAWLAGQILCGLVYRGQSIETARLWQQRIARAHDMSLRLNNPWMIGDSLHKLAAIEVLNDHFEQALAYLAQSEHHLMQAGDGIYATVNLVWLGILSQKLEQFADSKRHFLRALFQMQHTGFEFAEHIEISYCLQGLAELAAIEQQPERMAQLLGAVEVERELLGGMASHWFKDMVVNAAVGRYEELAGEAVELNHFTQMWHIGRQRTLMQSVVYALDVPESWDWLDEAGK
jgi:non-specific serine/threonine protein kinase